MRHIVLITVSLLWSPRIVAPQQSRGVVVSDDGSLSTNLTGDTIDLGTYHALLIGINEYENLPKLVNAANDITTLQQILVGSYGFAPENVRILRDGEADKERILQALIDYRDGPFGPSDNLLVYYAGHGYQNSETEDGFWIPVNGTSSETSWISVGEIRRILRRINTKHLLLISDSCFSGTLTRDPILLERADAFLEVVNRESYQVIASGGLHPVADGGAEGKSLFAYYFTRYLEDLGVPYVTADRIFTDLQPNVVNASTLDPKQTPRRGKISGALDRDGQFVFARTDIVTTSSVPASSGPRRASTPVTATTEEPTPEEDVLERYVGVFVFVGFVLLIVAQQIAKIYGKWQRKRVAEMEGAIANGPARTYSLWQEWRAAGRRNTKAELLAADSLIERNWHVQALEILDTVKTTADAERLQAKAHSRSGDLTKAMEILTRLEKEGHLDTETSSMLAAQFKKWGRVHNDEVYLRKAYELYTNAFERTNDAYPKINAAAVALHIGEQKSAAKIARRVLDDLEGQAVGSRPWVAATRGEAHLILRELEDATRWYREAVVQAPTDIQAIAEMRSQARWNLDALDLPVDAMDGVLDVPRVVAFLGNPIDPPGNALRQRARELLREFGKTGFVFMTLLNDSDLIFAREVLKVLGQPRVVLPYGKRDFDVTEIRRDGENEHEAVLVHERAHIHELSPDQSAGTDVLGDYGVAARALLREAMDFAAPLDEKLVVITYLGDDPSAAAKIEEAIGQVQGREVELERVDI